MVNQNGLPNGWRDTMGQKIFSHIISWRIEACKGRTQQQLNTKFDLTVEQVRDRHRNNNSKRGTKRTFRKTTVQEDSDDENKETSDDETPQKRCRIRLAKSGDILTEKNM